MGRQEPRQAAPAKPRLGGRGRYHREGYLFVAPALVLFLAFGVIPIVFSGWLSFHKWNGIQPARWVGLDNFASFLWRDTLLREKFWDAMGHNVVLAVIVAVGTIVVSIPLAILLNRVRFRGVFRTFLILPMVTAGITVYYTWVFLYRADGPLGTLLHSIGLGSWVPSHGWLSGVNTALPALAVVLVWTSVPLATLLYLAGLQAIDQSLHESAAIDGASRWQRLWHIDLPLLRPVTIIVVNVCLVESLQAWVQVYLMTGGGPTGHTNIVGLIAYSYAFGGPQGGGGIYGTASAIGWFIFILLAVTAFLTFRLLRPKDEA